MKQLEQCVNALFDEGIAEHLAICVGQADKTVCELYRSQTEPIDYERVAWAWFFAR